MNNFARNQQRVLAIDPTTRGFGFAVFEGPDRLVDWGTFHARRGDKRAACLRRVEEFIDYYLPNVIVLEDYDSDKSRRCARVRELVQAIGRLATTARVRVRAISPVTVRRAFAISGATTKEQIAGVLAARYPELLPHLPPHRKPWMSEDVRMSIFDGAALAHAHFRFANRRAATRSLERKAA